jgi:hypothetical protein
MVTVVPRLLAAVGAADEARSHFTDHLGLPAISRTKEDFGALDILAVFNYSID